MTKAVVLGPGGVVGTAWLAGFAQGLRDKGVDLGEADLIVGTSAGAIVGALLATGDDLQRLATPGAPTGSTYPSRLDEVFAVFAEPGLEPAAALRRVGEIALTAETGPESDHLARMGNLITARDWPDRALRIAAVDTATGLGTVWDRGSGAPLLNAVASSCAVPGVYPPITVNGGRYMDGAFRAGSNADLAAGAEVQVVIEPLAHLFPSSPLVGAGVKIGPDQETLDVFGADLHNVAAWEPSYQAGVRQAAAEAVAVEAVWR